MSSLKRILFYTVYILIILITLYYGSNYQNTLIEQSKNIYEKPNALHYYSIVYSIFIGSLFALPHIIGILNKTGVWKYDWIRSLMVGLPALFVTFLPVLYWTIPEYIQFLPTQLLHLAGPTLILPTICGVLFGYTLVSSFKKVF